MDVFLLANIMEQDGTALLVAKRTKINTLKTQQHRHSPVLVIIHRPCCEQHHSGTIFYRKRASTQDESFVLVTAQDIMRGLLS